MNSLISYLKDIINPDCIAACGSTNSHVTVTEEDTSATLKKITLCGLSKSMIVILPDKGSIIKDQRDKIVTTCISPLLRKSNPENPNDHNKACDAVAIRENTNNSYDILYIELKSGSTSRAEAQFKSTTCFVMYINELLKTFHDADFKINKQQYIIFTLKSRPRINKQPTRPSRNTSSSYDTPIIRQVESGDRKNLNHLF